MAVVEPSAKTLGFRVQGLGFWQVLGGHFHVESCFLHSQVSLASFLITVSIHALDGCDIEFFIV